MSEDSHFWPPLRDSLALPLHEVPRVEHDLSFDFVATDLEVFTVTATSVVITWITRRPRNYRGVPAPVATDTQLKLGPIDGSLVLVHDDPTPRAFHYVEITGLEPGRSYRFEAFSAGKRPSPGLHVTRADLSPERTNTFTTLTPPSGKYLGTIALANDIHVGESRQGINLGPLPTSVRDELGYRPYPEMMFGAMLDELTTAGHPFVVLNGDLTYDGSPDEVERVLNIAGKYGAQNADWLMTRGNHDYPRPTADPFGERIAAYQQLQTVQFDWGLRILGIDSTRKSSGGWIKPDQFAQIADEVRSDPDRPTLSVCHHPSTNDAAWSSISGPGFMLRGADRRRLQELHLAAPGVFAHHTGHTHRMRLDKADLPGAHTQYFENAACAAYPGGYALLHIFTGGYQVNFWRTHSPAAQRWTYRSRFQMFGIGPQFMLGNMADRNFVREFDFTGLRPSGQDLPSYFKDAI